MNYNFKIDNVFSVQRCANLKSELCTPGNIHYVTRTALNNGVQGLCGNTDYINEGNCIIIGGESAVAFYQNEPFVTGNNITVLRNESMSELSGLYIVSVLNKFTPLYSYSKAWNTKRIRETVISLPVIKSDDPDHVYTPDDIDWTYMEEHIRRLEEEHIRRLEEEHIRRLEEYLKVAGFESTILTPEEQEALRKIRTGGVIFRKYRICDLFELRPQSYRASKLDFRENGTVPAYSSDTRNNGCIGYVNHAPEFAISENIPVYLVFGDHTKTRNIVHQSFVGMDNIKVLRPKEKLTDEQLLYISSAWGKAIPSLGYARHWSVAKKALFLLPSTPSGEPDYDLMSTYIRALEKKTVQKLKEKYLIEEKATRKITENGN